MKFGYANPEVTLDPRSILFLLSAFMIAFGALLLYLSKKDEAPSLEVPLIPAVGKKIMAGALILGALVCAATAVLYPRF